MSNVDSSTFHRFRSFILLLSSSFNASKNNHSLHAAAPQPDPSSSSSSLPAITRNINPPPPPPPVLPFYRFYKRKNWYKSRNFLLCQVVTAALGIALLFVVLFPVVRAIAQHVVNVSVLNVLEAAIDAPTNST